MRHPKVMLILAVAITMAAVPAAAAKQENRRAKTVDVQLLALNDFHGNLEPPTGGGRITPPGGAPIDAGGAEYLATHIRRLEARNVSAGREALDRPRTAGLTAAREKELLSAPGTGRVDGARPSGDKH